MKKSELKEQIRKEILKELTTVTKNTTPAEATDVAKAENVSPATVNKAINTAKKMGTDINIAEAELNEMAQIAGTLKTAIEKVIAANKDAERKDLRKAIKSDAEVEAALGDDELFDNQLNRFIDLVRGERELSKRGRKPLASKEEPEMTLPSGAPEIETAPEKQQNINPAIEDDEDEIFPDEMEIEVDDEDEDETPETDSWYAPEEDEEETEKEPTSKAASSSKYESLQGKLVTLEKEMETLVKDMKKLSDQYKAASGEEKADLLKLLKSKTAVKKELGNKIDQINAKLGFDGEED